MYRPYITPLVRNIIIINVAMFFLTAIAGDAMVEWFALIVTQDRFLIRPYQLFTHMFMHADLMHILSNMMGLFFFGTVLEHYMGQQRFLTLYVVSGLGAGLLYAAITYYRMNNGYDGLYYMGTSVMLGASGALFGILAAFAMYFPDIELMIFLIPFPIKAKYLIAGYAVMEIIMEMNRAAGDRVAHLAHLGGMLFAFLLVTYWRKFSYK